MKLKLLIALFLAQPYVVFGSLIEDDMRDAFEKMGISVQSHVLEAPALNYDDMRLVFLTAPKSQTLILIDKPTGLPIEWQLEWHTNLVQKDNFISPSAKHNPCINMMCARGLHIMQGNDRFVTYRLDFEHTETKEVISPFYNLFYLKRPKFHDPSISAPLRLEDLVSPVPKVRKETILIPAPEIDAGAVEDFMKDSAKEAKLVLSDPIDEKASYRWKFVWHSQFKETYLTEFPKSDFSYHVHLMDDRGLEEKNKNLPFASYKVYVENNRTLEIIDPFWVFYLQWPALVNKPLSSA